MNHTAVMLTLGERIRAARQRHGWSQQQLADQMRDALHVDASKSSISNWERDLHDPGARIVYQLAHVLGVPADWLLEGAAVVAERETPEIHGRSTSTHDPYRYAGDFTRRAA